ncbi:hypothetical protein [Rhizobium skierniewicense]|uniref:hypothetical protein n=1 Tax=Rhizobium skierniewicense TaxID=984260 RepID=UPI0015716A82|nr:hypothetical protein [Rhizobium skierniewicense]NTF34280.1 hypothetical protein [Rhizobium skierniewicense]
MFQLLEKLLARAGYVRADSIVIPAPEIKYVTGQHSILSNGKHIFPTSTDSQGNPIHFERGISYIVGSNGRWRKRRVAKAPHETPQSRAEDGVADEVVTADDEYAERISRAASGWTQNRKVHNLPAQPRTIFSGSKHDNALYQHWHRLRASTLDPKQPNMSMIAPWQRFDTFAADVRAEGSFGLYRTMLRHDDTKTFGPGNFTFKPRSEMYHPCKALRRLTEIEVKHIRNSPQTLKSLASLYNMSVTSVRDVRVGKTYREIA